MKTFLFALLLCFSITAFAQESSDQSVVGKREWRVPPIPNESGEIVYKGETTVPQAEQNELYNRAYYWLKNNLKSDDLQMRNNKQTGHLSGVGKIMYNQSVLMENKAQGIYFDYDVWVKDGSYNYKISNLKAVIPNGKIDYSIMYVEENQKLDNNGTWTHKYRYEMLSDMHSFITLFISGLNAAIAKN